MEKRPMELPQAEAQRARPQGPFRSKMGMLFSPKATEASNRGEMVRIHSVNTDGTPFRVPSQTLRRAELLWAL